MRVVVKVGTSSLTDVEGRIRLDVITSVARQLAAARAAGHEVLLVTSGAVLQESPDLVFRNALKTCCLSKLFLLWVSLS